MAATAAQHRAEKQYYARHKHQVQVRKANWHQAKKIRCLTFYGKDGQLQCCWPHCVESDIDVLTLDHINDDGAEHRKQVSTSLLYSWLIKNGFPSGFQTLCWNHQWKKRRLKEKERWL